MAITFDQAISEDRFHEVINGKCYVWRRNGRTKTWKRQPDSFSVPVKHGLYQYGHITDREADSSIYLPSDCPICHGNRY